MFPSASDSGSERTHHRDAGAGAILWSAALGNMNMKGLFRKNLLVQPIFFCIGLKVGQCGGSTFLHYISQISSELEFSFTVTDTGFNEKNIAAHIGPGEPHSNTRHVSHFIKVIAVSRFTQYFFYIFFRNERFEF